jgi:hypothetical protein
MSLGPPETCGSTFQTKITDKEREGKREEEREGERKEERVSGREKKRGSGGQRKAERERERERESGVEGERERDGKRGRVWRAIHSAPNIAAPEVPPAGNALFQPVTYLPQTIMRRHQCSGRCQSTGGPRSKARGQPRLTPSRTRTRRDRGPGRRAGLAARSERSAEVWRGRRAYTQAPREAGRDLLGSAPQQARRLGCVAFTPLPPARPPARSPPPSPARPAPQPPRTKARSGKNRAVTQQAILSASRSFSCPLTGFVVCAFFMTAETCSLNGCTIAGPDSFAAPVSVRRLRISRAWRVTVA